MQEQSRREFLKSSVISTLGATTLGYGAKLAAFESQNSNSEKLEAEPICTFHNTLHSKFLSIKGERMNDGRKVPGRHDGMACYDGPNDTWVLVRNHENVVSSSLIGGMSPNAYDRVGGGGTSTVVMDKNLNLISHHMSLQGTLVNCSGGKTPWNSWLTCEEFVEPRWLPTFKPHGYVFEVHAFKEGVQKAEPLTAMGRFKHEAVAIDDVNQLAYLTEDQSDGCLYRYIPDQYPNLKTGTLQAMKIKDAKNLNIGKHSWHKDEKMEVEWVSIDEPNPKEDTVRVEAKSKGAAIVIRGEGIIQSGEEIYFSSTSGGQKGHGQIFHLIPTGENTAELTLVYESKNPKSLSKPDNITVNNFGDIIICEDGGYDGKNRVFGIRPDGKMYWIATTTHGEWTGCCFSSDYSVLFINVQTKGVTVAFQGDFSALRVHTV